MCRRHTCTRLVLRRPLAPPCSAASVTRAGTLTTSRYFGARMVSTNMRPLHAQQTVHEQLSAPLFTRTRPLLYRNVVENTLADTPSGYIQDPRAAPTTMVKYHPLTTASSAALDAMEHERQLMEKEELAYTGYTTLAIQTAKRTVMDPNATSHVLELAVNDLQVELEALKRAAGQQVDQYPSAEKIMLLKWQRWHERQVDPNIAFHVPPPSPPEVLVRMAEDGSEEVVVRRKARPALSWDGAPVGAQCRTRSSHGYRQDTSGRGNGSEDGFTGHGGGNTSAAVAERGVSADLWQEVEQEELDPALVAPTRVTVSVADVNHVRYIIGLACRRLKRFTEAEEANFAILRTDIRNVDAVESLLEQFTGLNDGESIQRLLDFLVEEFEAAAREGRLSHTDAAATAAMTETARKASAEAMLAGHRMQSKNANAGEQPSSDKVEFEDGTAPLVPPVEIALSMLADMIVEAATRHCAEYGEGSTSRFFLDCLSPLASSLARGYTKLLIEALFRSMDEQHYFARFELDEAAAARDDRLIYNVVIAFHKMLLVTRVPNMIDEPIQFRFFVLSKLHAALRSSGRRNESYRFCEEMLELYRANSSVYQQRRERILRERALRQATADGGESGVSATVANEVCRTVAPRPKLPLDDMDGSYRTSLLQYLNDRALDSASVGRELCLSAMEEFPEAAAPWETLALILHREDPSGNLGDAITAARRGLELEPFNLSLILTCANFYKAAHRYALYEVIMDRYRLLCYMLDNAASEVDLSSVGAEILAAEQEVVENVQDVREEELQLQRDRLGATSPKLIRSVEEWSRMHRETKSPRTFTHQQPVTIPSQELGISEQRPHEMSVDFRDHNDALGRRAGGVD